MFSNSHDQDICAELKHDIGIDQDPFYFLINNNLSSSDSSMITNTIMDNNVATKIKIWDDNLKISTFCYEIKKQGLSGVFCYRWENKTKKNVDEEQLSYYSMNSHCAITVS